MSATTLTNHVMILYVVDVVLVNVPENGDLLHIQKCLKQPGYLPAIMEVYLKSEASGACQNISSMYVATQTYEVGAENIWIQLGHIAKRDGKMETFTKQCFIY